MLKPTQRPRPPRHLDAEEASLWIELVGMYALDDPASLALLSSALEGRMRARLCREQVARDGQTVLDDHGTMKSHPLLQIERNAQSQFLSAMRLLRLGLRWGAEIEGYPCNGHASHSPARDAPGHRRACQIVAARRHAARDGICRLEDHRWPTHWHG
jgi:hypothetical protein